MGAQQLFLKRFGLDAPAQLPGAYPQQPRGKEGQDHRRQIEEDRARLAEELAAAKAVTEAERKLAEEARKQAEAARAAVAADRKDEGEGQVATCPHMLRGRAFLNSLHLSATYLEPEHDRCYCPSCAAAVQMPDVLEQGSLHGSPYEVPKGWCVMEGESGRRLMEAGWKQK